MSDYARQHDFSTKTGTTIFGSEVDDDFDAALVAINSKVDESREASANGIATLGAGSLIPVGISTIPTSGGGQIPEASETALGAVELATSAEALAGTDVLRVITADTLEAVLAAADGDGLLWSAGSFDIAFDLLTPTTPVAGDLFAFADVDAGNGGKSVTLTNLNTALTLAGLGDYDANDHIDHTTVSMTSGTGMTGGGTIAATRTLNVVGGVGITANADDLDFDPSGLANLTIETLALDDEIVVYDTSGTVAKTVPLNSVGSKITASSTMTIDTQAEANQIYVNTGASNHVITIAPESTFDFPVGTEIGFICESTGVIDIVAGAGVTINSLASNLGIKASGGGAYIVKTGTNIWTLLGDLEA